MSTGDGRSNKSIDTDVLSAGLVKAYATPARTQRGCAATCARGQVSHKP